MKILHLSNATQNKKGLEKKLHIVYKISNSDSKSLAKALKIDAFVGVIIKDSKIGKIKFEYSKKANDLQEGDLLELNIGKKKIVLPSGIGITEE